MVLAEVRAAALGAGQRAVRDAQGELQHLLHAVGHHELRVGAARLEQRLHAEDRGGGGNPGLSPQGIDQRHVMRETDACTLAAVPHDDLGCGMSQQPGGSQQAVNRIGVGRWVNASKHGSPRKMGRNQREQAGYAQRHPLHHRIA